MSSNQWQRHLDAADNRRRFGPVGLEAAEAELQQIETASARLCAASIRTDVGRFAKGLQYVSVYLDPIREFVTLGFSVTPEEPGDDEQPAIGATLEISEVWRRGVDIGVLTMDHTEELETALTRAIKL